MKVPRREVQLQFLLTFCLDENYNCSEIRYFLRKKNNTNRKIRTYQLQLVLDCIEYNVKIQQNYAQKSKHVYIYLCCIYLSILGSFKNDFWQKKSNNYIINCRQCAKIFIKSCNFMTFIHLLSTYYYNTKGKKSLKIKFHGNFCTFFHF